MTSAIAEFNGLVNENELINGSSEPVDEMINGSASEIELLADRIEALTEEIKELVDHRAALIHLHRLQVRAARAKQKSSR